MERGNAGRDRQLKLLEALQRSEQEMTGQQLYRCLQDKPGAMGLATVYRNLRQLQRQGQVRCPHLPTGEALYAPVERDQHHLTCVDCGKTERLEHCPIHGLHVEAPEAKDFDVIFHTLEFFGLCHSCRDRR